MLRVAGLVFGLGVLVVGCRPAPSPARIGEPAPVTESSPSSGPAAAAVDPEVRRATLATLRRVGVLGASASAGFGTSVPLSSALDATLKVPHEAYDVSSSAHYLRPRSIGRVQIEALKARGVSMVIAVDFLFWFAYGAKPDAERRRDLQTAMAMLDELTVPVFVGDLPFADPQCRASRRAQRRGGDLG